MVSTTTWLGMVTGSWLYVAIFGELYSEAGYATMLIMLGHGWEWFCRKLPRGDTNDGR